VISVADLGSWGKLAVLFVLLLTTTLLFSKWNTGIYLVLFLLPLTGAIQVASSQATGIGSIYFNHVLLLVLLLAWVCKVLVSRKQKAAVPLLIPITGLAVLVLISLYRASNSDSFREMILLLIPFITVILVVNVWDSKAKIVKAVNVLLWTALIQAIIGLYQVAQWIYENGFIFVAHGQFLRVCGLLGSPVAYNTFLIMNFAILLCLFLYGGQRNRRNLLVLLALVGAILLGFSRSAYISLILTVLFAGWYGYKRLILFFLCLFPLLSLNDLIWGRFTSTFKLEGVIKRIMTFKEAISQFLSYPLLGNGFGTFRYWNELSQEWYTNTHNMILFFAVSIGIFGIALYLAIYGITLKTAHRNYTTSNDAYFKSLSLGIYISILLSLVVGLVETNLIGVRLGWFTGFIMGIAFSIHSLFRKGVLN